MSFDASKFMSAKFNQRTEDVRVDALAVFFKEDSDPVWTVRGLTSSELSKCNEALNKQRNISTIMEAIMAASSNKDKVKEIREAMGLVDEQTPAEVAKRMEMLVVGSITPKVDLPMAVKLAEAFPIEFTILTNKITQLTGMGMELEDVGKSKPSGKTRTSKAASPSAT